MELALQIVRQPKKEETPKTKQFSCCYPCWFCPKIKATESQHTKTQNFVSKDILAAYNWVSLLVLIATLYPAPHMPKRVPSVWGVYWQKP